MRLAWFSPWPPQRSGVAGRSAELVPLLAERGHAIDVFVDASTVPVKSADARRPNPGAVRILSAHDFVWRHARGDYELPVYQVGNSHLHWFIWPYLFRYPGLSVMHDGRLHHARAQALMSRGRLVDYEAEFGWNHPETDSNAAGFVLLGLDGPFLFEWPMHRGVVEASRVAAAHSPGLVDLLKRCWPQRPVEHIALGEGRFNPDVESARARVRSRLHLDDATLVFGVFGELTSAKLIPEILAAFRHTRAWVPDARLVLCGVPEPGLDLEQRLTELGLTESVCHVEAHSDDEFDDAIAAVDVMLNLRSPTAYETSGPWVRGLALGRPTIITDLPHQAHVPTLDPRTWRRHVPCRDLAPGADERAVAVALDLRDLSRLLRSAMRRLAMDADLRSRLGRQARLWWEQEHTMARMIDDYERAFTRAVDAPAPSPDWPSHMRPDPASHTCHVVAQLDDPTLWSRLSGFCT